MLIDSLPCNFRGNGQPQFQVVLPDLLHILGEPDERQNLPDGTQALDYILGYTFHGGNRNESRLTIMHSPNLSCRCVITTREDRTR